MEVRRRCILPVVLVIYVDIGLAHVDHWLDGKYHARCHDHVGAALGVVATHGSS